jgi:hypothetical protein
MKGMRSAAIAMALLGLTACGSGKGAIGDTAGDRSTPVAGSATSTGAAVAVESNTPASGVGHSAGGSSTAVAGGTPVPGATSPASVPPGSQDPAWPASFVVPPAGLYVYNASGYIEWDTASVSDHHDVPPVVNSQWTTSPAGNGATEVDFTFDYGFANEKVRTQLSATQALFESLEQHSNGTQVTYNQTITCQPPFLVARQPLRVGDRWNLQWSDPHLQMQGSGTGQLLRTETVQTGYGGVEAVVVQLDMSLSGSATGGVHFTVWLDPRTGMEVKRVEKSTVQTFGETEKVDMQIVLRSHP